MIPNKRKFNFRICLPVGLSATSIQLNRYEAAYSMVILSCFSIGVMVKQALPVVSSGFLSMLTAMLLVDLEFSYLDVFFILHNLSIS